MNMAWASSNLGAKRKANEYMFREPHDSIDYTVDLTLYYTVLRQHAYVEGIIPLWIKKNLQWFWIASYNNSFLLLLFSSRWTLLNQLNNMFQFYLWALVSKLNIALYVVFQASWANNMLIVLHQVRCMILQKVKDDSAIDSVTKVLFGNGDQGAIWFIIDIFIFNSFPLKYPF